MIYPGAYWSWWWIYRTLDSLVMYCVVCVNQHRSMKKSVQPLINVFIHIFLLMCFRMCTRKTMAATLEEHHLWSRPSRCRRPTSSSQSWPRHLPSACQRSWRPLHWSVWWKCWRPQKSGAVGQQPLCGWVSSDVPDQYFNVGGRCNVSASVPLGLPSHV
jgi:hypothetical protein